ncbi:short chain dehydrogenase [Pandoraea vervacti]|uniref:Short chain dehydrogenase n=1 Tax=Pandoraea vervacti TaxID=656178 RepID=A0ABM5SW89_9BURK|nr:SDR family oxidoreductase [Pandoraea vervacti]AJP56780.1 short chain dehydrogenase [Pandoraea vervacti]
MQTNDGVKRVVLVTGGAKGVGRGITEQFLASGAEVVVCGREAPTSLPRNEHGTATFIEADLRDVDAVDRLFDTIKARFGRLDVLVNNAGGTPFAMAADGSPRFHDAILKLNLHAPLLAALKANAIMQAQASGGVIIFIGSIGATTARPGSATYAAAKAGILSLTRSLAVEWAPKVRVVCVSPGLVQTEQSHLHYGDEQGIAAVSETVPLKRMAQPADIGSACVFMASAGASYISGVDLLVHGGGERPAFLSAANVNHA